MSAGTCATEPADRLGAYSISPLLNLAARPEVTLKIISSDKVIRAQCDPAPAQNSNGNSCIRISLLEKRYEPRGKKRR